jgi:hypothetical protein
MRQKKSKGGAGGYTNKNSSNSTRLGAFSNGGSAYTP